MKKRYNKPTYQYQVVKITRHGKNHATIYYAEEPTSSMKNLHKKDVKLGIVERLLTGESFECKLSAVINDLRRRLRLKQLKGEMAK